MPNKPPSCVLKLSNAQQSSAVGIGFYVDETLKHTYYGQVLQIYVFGKQSP